MSNPLDKRMITACSGRTDRPDVPGFGWLMKPHRAGDGERILAVFIDFENLALGFGNRRDRFQIEKVLERLVEKGKIVAKKAYADWSRFGNYASALHACAVELIEIPKRTQTGKNSADIRMCVDAMDLAYSKDHIDTFVVVSGDSDFSPLVSKLKELGKHVIGLGLADSTSDLLRDNCDEFIYYEDLAHGPASPLAIDTGIPEVKRKAFNLLLDSLIALRRENKETMYSSMVKDTMKRKKPSFNEEYHGYRTFSELLEDAQRFGFVELERHKTNGMYVVTRFEPEPRVTAQPASLPPGKPVLLLPAKPLAAIVPPKPQAAPAAPLVEVEPRPPVDRRRVVRRPVEPPPPPQRPMVVVPPRPSHVVEPVAEVEDERMPLGRALIDDVDIDDSLDDVPSYMPRKPSPTTKAPVGKSAVKAPVKLAEKPRTRTPAAAKPQAARRQPQAKAPAAPRERKAEAVVPMVKAPAPPPVAPPPVRPAPRPASPPPPVRPPQPPADNDFGAGLDD